MKNISPDMPLVSIIIPCYNCEKYVETAVRSIIVQTYSKLEILITDDCSTDSSYSILQSLAQEDGRIILIRNEKNLKLPTSLNSMIDLARGEYIARMDADDISLPERIEKQVEWLELHSDYAICGTNAWHINRLGRKTGTSKLPTTNEEIAIAKYYSCPFYHPSVMIRKDILKKYKYNECFILAQDYELWFRILHQYKGYNLKQRLLLYRDFPVSSSNNSIRQEMLKKIFAVNVTNNDLGLSEKYAAFIERRKIYDDTLDALLKKSFKNIINCNGYNFYILLKYFVYFLNQRKIQLFFLHLSLEENCKFTFRLIYYVVSYFYNRLKRKWYN
jgi:glycosyltransferase involved in cell wall biosynthesis